MSCRHDGLYLALASQAIYWPGLYLEEPGGLPAGGLFTIQPWGTLPSETMAGIEAACHQKLI
jgi:hypothetical protein